MSAKELHEYQSKITHRIRVTVPVTVIVETTAVSYISAQARVLNYIAGRLSPETSYRYSWQDGNIDESEMGTVKFDNLALKPVPDYEPEPEEVEAEG